MTSCLIFRIVDNLWKPRSFLAFRELTFAENPTEKLAYFHIWLYISFFANPFNTIVPVVPIILFKFLCAWIEESPVTSLKSIILILWFDLQPQICKSFSRSLLQFFLMIDKNKFRKKSVLTPHYWAYSRLRNKHRATLINFWNFFQGLRP